jgi:hypothetical protein
MEYLDLSCTKIFNKNIGRQINLQGYFSTSNSKHHYLPVSILNLQRLTGLSFFSLYLI